MNSSSIRKQINEYQEITRRLSASINAADVDWHDEVYISLKAQIGTLAATSKQVVNEGVRVYDALFKFEKILDEG